MNKKEVKELVNEEYEDTVDGKIGEYLEVCPLWEKDEVWRVRMNTRNKEHHIVRSKFLHVDFEDSLDIMVRDRTIVESGKKNLVTYF